MRINENYTVETDSNGCTLVCTTPKTGEMKHDKREMYHYPTIKHCLVRFLELEQKGTKGVAECIKITNDALLTIKAIKM